MSYLVRYSCPIRVACLSNLSVTKSVSIGKGAWASGRSDWSLKITPVTWNRWAKGRKSSKSNDENDKALRRSQWSVFRAQVPNTHSGTKQSCFRENVAMTKQPGTTILMGWPLSLSPGNYFGLGPTAKRSTNMSNLLNGFVENELRQIESRLEGVLFSPGTSQSEKKHPSLNRTWLFVF